jgi:spermidine synthase
MLFLFTTAILIIDIVFIRGFRRLFGGVTGGYLPFHIQMVGLVLAIIPLSLLTGLLFQWAAKRFLVENQTLAKAYSLESAGGVLGGLSSTLLLALGLQNLSAGFICGLCSLGVVTYYSWKDKFPSGKYFSIAGFAFLLVLLGVGNQVDRWMTSWDHPYLVESKDTPYSRVTVTSLEEQVNIFENDALSYETETTAAEEFVQLSTLQAPNPGTVLVLGGGFEGIARELLKLPVKKIDYVEINKSLIAVVRHHLPSDLNSSFNDKRVQIIYEDPRQFLSHSLSYDVIMAAMPEPMSAQNNRFYTGEFFEQCSRKLNKDGVFAFRIPSAENLWTSELQDRNRSIYAALKSAFSSVVVIPGVTNIFIASNSSLTTNPAILIDRFRIRKLETKMVTPEYINYVYTNDRFGEIEKLLSAGTPVPNSDTRPACYGYTISIWLSKFFGDFTLPHSPAVTGIVTSPITWILIIVALIVAISRRFSTTRRFVLMSLAGFVGMVSETLLLMNYQNKSGALYQDIGILLMTFMLGLSFGALMANRFLTAAESVGRKHTWIGRLLFLGFGLMNAMMYYAIKFNLIENMVSTSLLLILDGVFVSAIFAFVSFSKVEDGRKAMIWFYSADLIGGGIGSLAVSLILLPIFGILSTSILTAAVAVCALAFLR